jgi:DNA repair protein RadA/Sms
VIASSFRDQLVLPRSVVLGEVGLNGEIRSISSVLTRINEAEKLGFKHCILPKNSIKNLKFKKSDMEIIAVSTLKEALGIILSSSIKEHGGIKK